MSVPALLAGTNRGSGGIAEAALEDRVFPDSRAAAAIGGLTRRG